MRDSLGWSYSMAGFMNTINAAGYLAGALGASAVIKRFGMFNIIRISAVACVLSLVMSASSPLARLGCYRVSPQLLPSLPEAPLQPTLHRRNRNVSLST